VVVVSAQRRRDHVLSFVQPFCRSSPWPPTGVVTTPSLKPAMSGLPRPMASLTVGSDSDASWLALPSHAFVIQMAFASFVSFAMM
jgi:hypothetical protein